MIKMDAFELSIMILVSYLEEAESTLEFIPIGKVSNNLSSL